MLQCVYGTMDYAPHNRWPTDTLIDHFDALLASTDSVSVMVDWPNDSGGMVVARHFSSTPGARDIDPPPDWMGVPLETGDLPPLLGANQVMKSTHWGTATDVLFWFMSQGVVFGPQPPDELQLEYFVPLSQAKAALHAVRDVASSWGETVSADPAKRGLLLYCELRVVAEDDLWLSQNTAMGGGDTLALAFGMNKFEPGLVMAAAAAMESCLERFHAKPHWAKMSTMSPHHIRALYGDSITAFRDLILTHDPDGRFRNAYVDELFLR